MGQARDNGRTPGAAQRACACGTRLSASNTGTRCAVCERKFAEGVNNPPVMPRNFWYTERFREAFESRNMGNVLRAFRTDERHKETYGPGGIRQVWLASWLGITQVQVSRLERGESLTDSHEKMIQWAQVLSIPGELLWFDLPGQNRQKLPPRKPANRVKTPATKHAKRVEFIAARKAAGLTQEQLAERMCVDRKTVTRWEAGERVPQPYLQPKLAKMIGVSAERLVELLAAPSRTQAMSLEGSDPSREPVITATDRANEETRIRTGEQQDFAGKSLDSSALKLNSTESVEALAIAGDSLHRRDFLASSLMAGLGALIQMPASGRRVGSGLVAQLRRRNARLRRLDDFLGGVDTVSLYKAELRSTVDILKESTHSEPTTKGLLSVVAEQAQQAGWAAFDAGQHAEARRLFQDALSAAKESEDTALEGNSWAYMAYQAVSSGNSGVDLAVNSYSVAGSDAPPRVQALLLERLAWTYAKDGQADDAERALARAAEILDESGNRDTPHWASWVDDREIKIMTGRCWAELHRPMRAILALEEALSGFSDDHARDKALYMSWLAEAYFEAHEIEQAATVIEQAINLSTGVGSVRPQQRIESFAQRLVPYRRLESVSQILDRFSI